MRDRDINYLLKKYETKDVNELWSTEHETQYKQNQKTKERLAILDGIINERKTISKGNFRFTGMQRGRAHYLIKNIDFRMGRVTQKQLIVMIIAYVKLEKSPSIILRDFYPLLNDYDISLQTFVVFLIRLNEFHIDKIPVYN